MAVAAVVKPGSARRDFGSFHSSNVQETINLADVSKCSGDYFRLDGGGGQYYIQGQH